MEFFNPFKLIGTLIFSQASTIVIHKSNEREVVELEGVDSVVAAEVEGIVLGVEEDGPSRRSEGCERVRPPSEGDPVPNGVDVRVREGGNVRTEMDKV